MGTSSPTSGTGSDSPLVPSWLDEPDTSPLPGEQGVPDGDAGTESRPHGDQDNTRKPPIPPLAPPNRFKSARANFSRFARSGGSDRRALKRAVRDYVRKGTRGPTRAGQRMGPSRVAAGNALGIFRGFQRHGIHETLRRLNLQSLTGRSLQEIFIGLTDIICRDGDTVDEAIARDAWLETIADLDKLGIEDLETLSMEQVQEVFLQFIAHTVETRLYQEIGVNGFEFAKDLDDISEFDNQFRDYIERSVRDSFTGDLTQLSDMSDRRIRHVVEQTYRDVWELLQLLGDQQE